MKVSEFIESIEHICYLYGKHKDSSTSRNYSKLLTAKRKFLRDIYRAPEDIDKIFAKIEELFDVCTEEDAVKNGCSRDKEYYAWKNEFLNYRELK